MAEKEKKEIQQRGEQRALTPFQGENWLEDFFRRPFSSLMQSPFWTRPEFQELSFSADMSEHDGNIVIRADMPGVKKEDIDISLENDVVTIRGERRREEKEEKENFYRLERSYGSFSRSFRLPPGTESDRADASFKDGVLELKIPRPQSEEKRKKIPLK